MKSSARGKKISPWSSHFGYCSLIRWSAQAAWEGWLQPGLGNVIMGVGYNMPKGCRGGCSKNDRDRRLHEFYHLISPPCRGPGHSLYSNEKSFRHRMISEGQPLRRWNALYQRKTGLGPRFETWCSYCSSQRQMKRGILIFGGSRRGQEAPWQHGKVLCGCRRNRQQESDRARSKPDSHPWILVNAWFRTLGGSPSTDTRLL